MRHKCSLNYVLYLSEVAVLLPCIWKVRIFYYYSTCIRLNDAINQRTRWSSPRYGRRRQRGVQVPSGKPEFTRMSFSCTLASQVILRVDMLRRLCSQKRISASSPFTLSRTMRGQLGPGSDPAAFLTGRCRSPNIVPGLEDRQQRHVVREAVPGEVPVDEAEALPVVDERLRETGSGRDGAHGVADTRGRQRDGQRDLRNLPLTNPGAELTGRCSP